MRYTGLRIGSVDTALCLENPMKVTHTPYIILLCIVEVVVTERKNKSNIS